MAFPQDPTIKKNPVYSNPSGRITRWGCWRGGRKGRSFVFGGAGRKEKKRLMIRGPDRRSTLRPRFAVYYATQSKESLQRY